MPGLQPDNARFGAARYERVAPLGRGGMASVDLVARREGRFERLYALKRLHPHVAADPGLASALIEEARIVGSLRHANIVSLVDFGTDTEGPYLVMDYIEGVSLVSLLRQHHAADTVFPVAVAVRIAEEIANGLSAAHTARDLSGRSLEIIHRDVSPSNVLIGHDGVVRLIDFGIAKALGCGTMTQTGVLKGKPGYMAPEQLRFDVLDARCDLFALGVVLFETLSCKPLYPLRDGGPSRILNDPPPDIGEVRPDVPPALVDLLFRLLAKDRENRPRTAADVAARLRAIREELEFDHGSASLRDHLAHVAVLPPEGAEPTEHRRRIVDDSLKTVSLFPTSRPRRRWWRPRAPILVAAAAVALLTVGLGALAPGNEPAAMAPRVTVTGPVPEESPEAVGVGLDAGAGNDAPAIPERIAIEFLSTPSNAKVWVGESYLGRTPLTVEMPLRGHGVRVRVSRRGYISAETIVVPDANRTVRLDLERVRPRTRSRAPAPPGNEPAEPTATEGKEGIEKWDGP